MSSQSSISVIDDLIKRIESNGNLKKSASKQFLDSHQVIPIYIPKYIQAITSCIHTVYKKWRVEI